jgi:hypothetical protein
VPSKATIHKEVSYDSTSGFRHHEIMVGSLQTGAEVAGADGHFSKSHRLRGALVGLVALVADIHHKACG